MCGFHGESLSNQVVAFLDDDMIDRAHLEQWADMQSAKGDFPELIQRLVYASVAPYLEKCNIPYGSAVYLGGSDGEVDATQQTEYIPQGKSLLEFGTNKEFGGARQCPGGRSQSE